MLVTVKSMDGVVYVCIWNFEDTIDTVNTTDYT